MSGRKVVLVAIIIVALVSTFLIAVNQLQSRAKPAYSANVISALSGGNTEGFARALEVRDFEFPQDHAAHPDFQTEWWYYTGNLAMDEGRRFGFQITIFRR